MEWRDETKYDRGKTKELIKEILADDNAQYILFNDPEIINDPQMEGVVISWEMHDNHLHVVYRE